MRLTITAVGLDLSDSTRTYVEEKIGKLEKLIVPAHRDSALADVKLLYAPSNTTSTKDKCTVTISGLGEKHVVHIETEEPDMLVAIDRAAHKLKEPLRRFEERFRDHITKGATDAKRRMQEDASVPADTGVDLEGDEPA